MRKAVARRDASDPDINDAGQHLWQWFWDASRRRQYGISGPLPLGSAEFLAWATITGNPVDRDEWPILYAMDDAYLQAVARTNDQTVAQENAEPLNAAAFDAVFG